MAYEKWEDVRPQEGKQLAVFKMIADNKVDFMLAGGSRGGGKSELLTMIPLLYCQDPGFRGVFLRREYGELMGANGIYEKSQSMYPLFKGKVNIAEKMWRFPSKANVRLRHLFHENDKESFRGQGYSFIGIDEIDQFSESSVQFLMTCLRSEANMNSFMVGTLNPSSSWCLPLVEYYLDEQGYPDPDKFGHIRWFIVKDGQFIFGPSEEFFKENHPESVYITLPGQKEPMYVRPKRFTFCFFSVLDNPALCAANPAYISELQNLPDHERLTQLYGNWYAKPKGMSMWKREWVRGENGERVKTYRDIPDGLKWFRGVDKGYSVKSDTNRYPDPSCISPKFAKDSNGLFWIVGDYNIEVCEDSERTKKTNEKILGKFCKLAGERDALILKQLLFDGEDTSLVLSKDLGAGTTDHTYTKALMIENGVRVVEDKSPKNTPNKKMKDFLPFANAAENGLVYIVEESFNPATLEAFYKELCDFEPEKRSCSSYHDDMPDSCSMAFSAANSARVIRIVPRNQTQSHTQAAKILNNHDVSIKETPQEKGINLNEI